MITPSFLKLFFTGLQGRCTRLTSPSSLLFVSLLVPPHCHDVETLEASWLLGEHRPVFTIYIHSLDGLMQAQDFKSIYPPCTPSSDLSPQLQIQRVQCPLDIHTWMMFLKPVTLFKADSALCNSPTYFLFSLVPTHSAPSFSKHARHASTSEPLRFLFPLLGTLFSPYSPPLGLCSIVT